MVGPAVNIPILILLLYKYIEYFGCIQSSVFVLLINV